MNRIAISSLVLLALVFLSSCNSQPKGVDGYHFEKGTPAIGEREIKVTTYPDYISLRASYAKQPGGRKLGSAESLQAFSVISERQCNIHMIEPATDYQPEFFGHELTHCLYGNFHPKQDNVRSANHL